MNKYFICRFILISSFLFADVVLSQNTKSDLLKSFEFKWSNDFENQTDYYYTNGFAFQFISPKLNFKLLNSLFLPYGKDDLTLHGVTLLQDIFTPKERKKIPQQLNGDRPFAAFILAGIKQMSFMENSSSLLFSELQIGVLGPAALGEEVQNGIHRMLPTSDEVLGWENQISNSFMLNYTASFQKFFTLNKFIDFSSAAIFRVGLPYTDAGLMVDARIGLFKKVPDEFLFLYRGVLTFYFNFFVGGNFVGYNATLQGGVFTNSVYTVDIYRTVGKAGVGFTLLYKSIMLQYKQTLITPEFKGGLHHSWGYLKINVKL